MRIVTLILALIITFVPVNEADTETHQIVQTVNGRAITFEAPLGMCVFDPEFSFDKDHLAYLVEKNRPENTVVLVFADCTELEKSRKWSTNMLKNFETILF